MTTRFKGPSAGFGWLKNGISVSFRHPKALFGGAAFLLLACLLPALITMPMQMHAISTGTPQSPTTVGLIMAFSMLIGLLIVPLYAGYLQVVDAAARGLPARALDIFKPYREGEALRLIGFGLTIGVVYLVVLGLILAVSGGGIVSWYIQVLAAQAAHQPPPGWPQGFGIAMALFTVLILFMMGFYAISLGQVALGRRGVFGAIGDGIVGALKNVLPLLVFALSLVLAWIAVAIAIGLAVLLLTLLSKLVGPWLMIVLIIPIYIAMVLTMFAVTFGVMYHLWRDVCGDNIESSVAMAAAI
ncbi:hypothetical protein ISN76_02575 [Dyella halodurans]|uniref:Uncharacterized protein n=1 Tax=Dyella halodurans TaxID=1920171 RepID=A0ABV9BXY7_9GAMM|nr:hypothetical protein [Dyella halodurans]